MKTRVYLCSCLDPWLNLAYEEYLVDTLGESEAVLFLWRNRDTVVIGRNQNPWRECSLRAMERDGVRLARRVTGGGAVFHDDGNLNFSFVVPRNIADVARQSGVILEAVKAAGLEAERSGRNDLLCDGRKFSGNAFLNRKHASLHHGTILIGADMARLSEYLNVPADKLAGKGVASVRSRVVNLAELQPELTTEIMAERVVENFSREYGMPSRIERIDLVEVPAEVEMLRVRNASREWLLGKTPEFTMSIRRRFPWGEVEIGFEAKHGLVSAAAVYTDGLEPELSPVLAECMKNRPFEAEPIAEAIRNAAVEDGRPDTLKEMLFDVAAWMQDNPL